MVNDSNIRVRVFCSGLSRLELLHQHAVCLVRHRVHSGGVVCGFGGQRDAA